MPNTDLLYAFRGKEQGIGAILAFAMAYRPADMAVRLQKH